MSEQTSIQNTASLQATSNALNKTSFTTVQAVLYGAVVVALCSFGWQAWSFVLVNKTHQVQLINLQSSSQNTPLDLWFHITYPTSVRFEDPETPGRVMTVRLWETQLITPSVITVSNPRTFSINFESSDSRLLFTDKDGTPVASKIQIVPGSMPGEIRFTYLHQAPLTQSFSDPVSLTATVESLSPSLSFKDNPVLTVLKIDVESHWMAGLRYMLNLLFGPTTFLLAVVGSLIGFGIQHWVQEQEKEQHKREEEQHKREEEQRKRTEEEQRKRTEEEQRRDLAQKRQEIMSLRILIKRDMIEAIWLWMDYHQKVNFDSTWQKEELKMELEQVGQLIGSSDWLSALLKQAASEFNNANRQQTLNKTAAALQVLAVYTTEPKAVEWLGSHLAKGLKETSVIDASDPQETIDLLLWIYYEFCEIARPVVIALAISIVSTILVQLAQDGRSFEEIYDLLAGSVDNRKLLKEPEFAEPLKMLTEDNYVPTVAQEVAKRLLEIRRELHYWPPLWTSTPLTETLNIKKWLKLIGLTHNPFGPEQAELDPLLPDYRLDPSKLEDSLRGARPVILFGASGSGKTAMALLLAYDSTYPSVDPREKDIFPVYHRFSLDAATKLTPLAYLNLLTKAVSRALIHFMALNPYTFLEHQKYNKVALAYLLTSYAGSLKNLEIHFRQAKLSLEGAGQRLMEEIAEIGQDVRYQFEPSEDFWLDLLQDGRPLGFTYTSLLTDVIIDDLDDQGKVAAIARQLQTSLGLIAPLANVCVYSKLFLPEAVWPHLHLPADVIVKSIHWTNKELHQLLQERLSLAGASAFSQLFNAESNSPDLVMHLIKAANGSPRKLIQLGNQIIREHVSKTPVEPKISYETLNHVLESANN